MSSHAHQFLFNREAPTPLIERLGLWRTVSGHGDADFLSRLCLEPFREQLKQCGANAAPPVCRRHEDVLDLARTAVTRCPMSRDVTDDRIVGQCHIPDSREESLVWMVLASQVGGHARFRRTVECGGESA